MPASTRKQDLHRSKDGLWSSFPQVPNLLQYVSSAKHYARIKVRGKIMRKSLGTEVWTTAKLRLLDFLRERRQARSGELPPKFSEAVELFIKGLADNPTMKLRSKYHCLLCLQKLQRTWPELWNLRLHEITPESCKQWAARLNKQIATQKSKTTPLASSNWCWRWA